MNSIYSKKRIIFEYKFKPKTFTDMENIIYKGFTIETQIGNHCSLIYKNGNLFKCIAGNIKADYSNDCIEKSMNFIDSL